MKKDQDKSYTFSSLVAPDQARRAAAKLWQFCLQSGCLYCPFFEVETEGCELRHRPRNYPIEKIRKGGGDDA